jgi:hypothetical protein
LAFEPSPSFEVEVVLRGGSGREAFDLKFQGKMRGGSEGVFMDGNLPECPLEIGLQISKRVLENGGDGASITTSWNPRQWIGRPLKSLPWLEPVTFFWRALVGGGSIEAIFSRRGNRLSRGHIQTGHPSDSSRDIAQLCQMLWRARELDSVYDFGLTVPDSEDLWDFDWDDIDIAFDLHTTGRHQRTTPNFYLQLSHIGEETDGLRGYREESEMKGAVRLALRPYTIFAFGRSLPCGDAQLDLNPVLWRRLKSPHSGGTTSEIAGTPETLFVLTRPTEIGGP